jgi:hypothetical protein
MISSYKIMDAKRALNKIGTKNVTAEIAQTDLVNGDVSGRGYADFAPTPNSEHLEMQYVLANS